MPPSMRIERRISTPTATATDETQAQPPPEQPSEPTPAPTSSPTEATARDARLISANEPGSAQLRMRLDEQLSNTIDTRADITKEMVEQQVPQDLRAQVNDVLSRRSGDALERDAALVRDALASENNRDAALRTFVELSRLEDLDARDDKERITPEIKQALVHAVAGSKSDHPGGEEGILDERSAIAAAERLRQLPQSQYDRVKGLLDGRSETEQSLILKKMMAHRDLNDAA